MSGLTVTLAGHEFNTGLPDQHGIRWSLDITSGWWNDPEMDDEQLPTIGEGSAFGRVMLRHRSLVCRGTAKAPTSLAHARAHLVLETLDPVYELAPLVVHELTGPRFLMVKRHMPKDVTCHGLLIEFQLTLVAPDPAKLPFTEETP